VSSERSREGRVYIYSRAMWWWCACGWVSFAMLALHRGLSERLAHLLHSRNRATGGWKHNLSVCIVVVGGRINSLCA